MGTFSRLPASAVLDNDLPPHLLRTLACLGLYADENGIAYPSVRTMAARLSRTPRQVIRDIKALTSRGYIMVEKRTHMGKGQWGRNTYQLQYEVISLKSEVTSSMSPSNAGHSDIPDVTQASEPLASEVTSDSSLGDISQGVWVTSSMSQEGPNTEQPNKEGSTIRAFARPPLISNELREQVAAMQARLKAEGDAERKRVARLVASMQGRQP
jgi:hypothetical protein